MFAPILFVVAFYSIVSTCPLSLFYKLYFLWISQSRSGAWSVSVLGHLAKFVNK